MLVRSVSTVESEWDDDERGWMLAYGQYLADIDPGCGHPLSESTDPLNEFRYTVGPPTRCHACTALEIAYDKAEKAKYKHPRALRFGAHLT